MSDPNQQIVEAVSQRAQAMMGEAMRKAGVEALARGVRVNDGFVLRSFCELAAVRISNLELLVEAILAAASAPGAPMEKGTT